MHKVTGNPFPVSGYHDPSTFCDQVEDTRILKQSLLAHRNITYDPYSGLPQVSVDMGRAEEQNASIAGLLDTLDLIGQPVVIALDEFQQNLKYPEPTIDAWLRR